MKILIIMTGFLPGKKFGGPPISVDNFCSLMKDHECYIVTRNHDMGESKVYDSIKPGWNDRGNCKVKYLSDKEYGYNAYIQAVEEICPDVIYLQGLFQNCILPCLYIAKKKNIPVLLAPRGELCAGAFKKKYKKIPYIVLAKMLGLFNDVHFQSTSDEETEAISKILNVESSRIHYLTNVPSIPKHDHQIPRKKKGQAKFVFISRIVRKKNLLAAISYFKEIKGDVVFDIYGPIEDKEYWQECKDEIEKLPDTVKVNYSGLLSHDKIHETFAQYHAFLFPTFSENYGHVIAEALSVGCPVIISDQTPWNDVEEYDAGFSVALENYLLYQKVIENIVSLNQYDYNQITINAKKFFVEKTDINNMRCTYESVLEKIINNKKH